VVAAKQEQGRALAPGKAPLARRALIEHRPWLFASIVAGVAYYFVWNNALPEPWLIALKGAGVGCLAIYALRRTLSLDGALLTLALALSAAADMVLVIRFEAGGALFFAAHLVAFVLYLRNLREGLGLVHLGPALLLLIITPLVAWLLSGQGVIALYACSLGVMAAGAWMSRFPRLRVGVGAMLFILSDWLLLSRMGPLDIAPVPDLLVWPTYYAGQLMIATGVVQTLRAERRARKALHT
jgi:uncharacterized membrane protein YhhN